MSLTRLSALDGEAILPLADCKEHLRVRHDDEDVLISQLRDAAIGHVERGSGVVLAPAQFRWTLRSFSPRVELPMRPATSIEATAYEDASGAEQPYTARLVDGYALPAVNEAWPTAYGYAAIDFTAGIAAPDDAPELLAAVKLLLGHLYNHREASAADTMKEIPLGVDALIGTYRRVMV